jgi:transcriptional regulator with PAS, ATPase and Fis domain|tara:strand:+ start:2247 stop:2513 length:267 start_codon:yes stop_codon:yes gene_type:complete
MFKRETDKEKNQRVAEQAYFFNMFDTMWGEILPEETQYSLAQELETLERERIINALALASGNQTKAAQSLDVGRTALIAKMKKYKLSY